MSVYLFLWFLVTKTPQKSNVQSSSRNNNSLVSSILHVSIMFYCVPVFILKSFFDSLDSVILSEANNLDKKKKQCRPAPHKVSVGSFIFFGFICIKPLYIFVVFGGGFSPYKGHEFKDRLGPFCFFICLLCMWSITLLHYYIIKC